MIRCRSCFSSVLNCRGSVLMAMSPQVSQGFREKLIAATVPVKGRWRGEPSGSGEQFLDHLGPCYPGVGQAVVAAGVGVGEAFVIEAEGVQKGGVQIGYAHHVADRPVP